MAYEEVSDAELIYLIRLGSNKSKLVLIDRYKSRIYGLIDASRAKFGLNAIDYEECYQEAMIVFLNCIDSYNYGNFYGYVKISIERVLYRLLVEEKQRESTVSYETLVGKELHIPDVINDSKNRFLQEELLTFIKNNFTELEQDIVQYKMKGYTSLEVAELLGIKSKTVYKTLRGVKDKLILRN